MLFYKEGKYINIKQKIVIYGCGEWLSYRWGWFQCLDNVVACSDKNTEKKNIVENAGFYFEEPGRIKYLEYDWLVVASESYYKEIESDLIVNYDVPMDKLVSGISLWNKFEELCDGDTIVSFGNKNDDKVFFVIAPLSRWFNNGLINLMNKIYRNVCYGLEKGYIPIIDMQNFYTIYHEEGELGNKNIWERYYTLKDKSDYKLDDVYQSRNVIFCYSNPKTEQEVAKEINLSKYPFYEHIDENINMKAEILDALRRVFGRKCLGKRVLGVSIRGSDYNLLKPKDHYVQPTLTQFKTAIDEAIVKWRIDYIYITSEEQSSLDYMYSIYNDKILTYECPLYDDYSTSFSEEIDVVSKIQFKRENDAFLRGKEYLVSTMLLTFCNCLISGMTSKINFLLNYLKIDFEEIFIFDLGRY